MKHVDYEPRRNRLRRWMTKEGLSAFLVTNFTNVTYLTGFSGDDSFLLLTPDRAVLLSDPRYEQQIAQESPELETFIRRGISVWDALRSLLDDEQPSQSSHSPSSHIKIASPAGKKAIPSSSKTPPISKKSSLVGQKADASSKTSPHVFKPGAQTSRFEMGLEAGSASWAFYNRIQEEFPEILFVPKLDWIEQLREIKDSWEIAAIRQAIEHSRRGFEIIRNGLLPQYSEIDIRNELEYQMRKLGANDVAFPSIIAVGQRASLPHAVPTSHFHVSDAELILFDWGAKTQFYVGDLTRVLVTKPKASAKLKKIYDIVLTAQKAAIDAIKPGIPACDIDAVARKIIQKAGYGDFFGHGLGHGIGMVVHDFGSLSPNNTRLLKPGMVLTVEPGIYLPDWGGVRIEDDILVTKTGCEVLSSKLPKEWDDMFL